MQTPPHFSLMRGFLFPHTGEEPLSPRQSWRVIITWALFFTFPMLLCTLVMAVITAAPLDRLLWLVPGVFLAGAILFGASAWFVILMVNRTAHLRKQHKNKD